MVVDLRDVRQISGITNLEDFTVRNLTREENAFDIKIRGSQVYILKSQIDFTEDDSKDNSSCLEVYELQEAKGPQGDSLGGANGKKYDLKKIF